MVSYDLSRKRGGLVFSYRPIRKQRRGLIRPLIVLSSIKKVFAGSNENEERDFE